MNRNAGLCLILLLLAGTPCLAQTADAHRIPRRYREATAALAAGNYAEARTGFRRLTADSPANGAHWVGLANAELGAGDPRAAVVAMRRALELRHGSRPLRMYQLARMHAFAGARDSALAWLDAALAAGFEDRFTVSGDTAFAALAEDARFRRLAAVPAEPASRDDGWRGDLDLLVAEARRLTAGAPRPATATPAFDSAVARVRASIPSLSNEQLFLELQRLTAMLGSGHSVLYPLPTERLALTLLPVDLYRFSDGMYIIGSAASPELVGARVDRIAGLTPEDALRRARPWISRDNEMGVDWVGPFYLLYPVILDALGGTVRGDTVPFELTAGGRSRSIDLVANGEFRGPDKLRAPATASRAPLWLSNPDVNYWLTPLPDARAIYAQYNQVVNADDISIAQFADSLLRAARDADARSIIVDVRRNNGGSGHLNRPLVQALVRFEERPGNRIFVITGRNTFSAAQNFINDVERWTDAIFVGEPSSSRPNFLGEDNDIMLPYSGIVGSIASRWFQDSTPTDDRVWIAPDIPAALSSADYFAGRDPVLDAALRAAAESPTAD